MMADKSWGDDDGWSMRKRFVVICAAALASWVVVLVIDYLLSLLIGFSVVEWVMTLYVVGMIGFIAYIFLRGGYQKARAMLLAYKVKRQMNRLLANMVQKRK